MREPSHNPEPKSACTWESIPIDATIAAEFDATGSASTRWFQTLVAGKTGHPPIVGGADAAEPVASVATAAPRAARAFTVAGVAPPSRHRVA